MESTAEALPEVAADTAVAEQLEALGYH
jgi:hypothetical protein